MFVQLLPLLGIAALIVLVPLVFWPIWPVDDGRRFLSAHPRSGKWPALERRFLAAHPTCAACGGDEEVVGHHVEPFHLHPEKELDPENLVALCNKRGCHLTFGHLHDWRAHNPHVREDAKFHFRRTRQRQYE